MATTFILPELGEDIDSGTVTRVLVAVGDSVSKDQPVLELETDKAVLEVPCPAAGNITEVYPKEGDTLRVGDPILIVDGVAPKSAPPAEDRKPESVEPPPETIAAPTIETPPAETPPPVEDEAPEPSPTPRRTVTASPAVRRLARQIGVDVQQVRP
ncbi:MAG: hypothetical protein IID40_11300, partial [Planctomycetes bacterium]|nr:hypothetical protein [Planctomycetota bacterium]